jgi:hypothetical protein
MSQPNLFAPEAFKKPERWAEDVSRGKANPVSKKAHTSLVPHKASICEKILALIELAPDGLTQYEVAEAMNKPVHTISGRFTEMENIEVETHGTRTNRYGNECAIYYKRNA